MTYIALLRGINVGGRVVKMADLKDCLEGLRLRDVRTLLQSGNVVFEANGDTKSLKVKIENGLTETFGYPAKVQVFNATAVAAIVSAYPFKADDTEYQNYVIFIEGGLERALAEEAVGIDEKVEVGDGAVYWQVKKGMTLKSTFAQYLTKSKYRDFHTNRNMNTLQKLVALAGE